jgi:pyruvate, orthophosphate dikinase
MRFTEPARYVFAFDHVHERPPMELKGLLGGKGANLAEMAAVLQLPVPPGFTITTEACRAYRRSGGRWPDGLEDQVADHLAALEDGMGRRLGDPSDPLLVSVRSGAAFSMPGMMDTVLNLGMTWASAEGLATVTGDPRFAYDAFRRFIGMYGRIVLGVDEPAHAPPVDDAGVDGLREQCARHLARIEAEAGRPVPDDPGEQLRGAIDAVFGSWDSPRARAYREHEGIPDDLGTAVTGQAMVFGNRDERSGTGVAFTRDAATGEDRPYGDFLADAQGEEVVAGTSLTEDLDALEQAFPEVHRELLDILHRLEAHYRDMCDTEFTVEQGRLWMLQTRIGKRTGQAAVRMAVDMAQQSPDERGWSLSREEALARVTTDHVEQQESQESEADEQEAVFGCAVDPRVKIYRLNEADVGGLHRTPIHVGDGNPPRRRWRHVFDHMRCAGIAGYYQRPAESEIADMVACLEPLSTDAALAWKEVTAERGMRPA